MTQAQQQLANASSTQGVLDTVVGLISELTEFHRVMYVTLPSLLCNFFPILRSKVYYSRV